jgi:hypothetical protein
LFAVSRKDCMEAFIVKFTVSAANTVEADNRSADVNVKVRKVIVESSLQTNETELQKFRAPPRGEI